jgi:hypothetical protein
LCCYSRRQARLFGVPDVESIASRVIVVQSACCKYGVISTTTLLMSYKRKLGLGYENTFCDSIFVEN